MNVSVVHFPLIVSVIPAVLPKCPALKISPALTLAQVPEYHSYFGKEGYQIHFYTYSLTNI